MNENELSFEIVGAAIDVHQALGPGLLESAYEMALCRELHLRGFEVEKQKALPVVYKGQALECGYRIDLMVNQLVIVEVKSVEKIAPIHEVQLLTYLRLAQKKLGMLLNFNCAVMKDGIRRVVNNL